MRRLTGLVLGAVAAVAMGLGGCTNTYDLRYAAIPQPRGAHLFADYTQLQDGVGLSVDTDGHRLQDIYIKKGDAVVHPVSIAPAGYYQSAAIGTGLGGFGGHVGGGLGMGIPVGPKQTHGLTGATFSGAAIGPGPWDVHVKVQDVDEAVIPGVGGKATAK